MKTAWQKQLVIKYVLSICLVSLSVYFNFAKAETAANERLELESNSESVLKLQELFIWKMSESLELDAAQEQKFAKLIREVSLEKRAASAKMAKLTAQIESKNKDAKMKEILNEYRQSLNAYSDAQKKEYDELSKILTDDKMAKYIVLKNDISTKIKVRLMRRLQVIEHAENKKENKPLTK